ncbi:hypothetical protein DEU56DRAFT_11563 [Suillus clintonianus]|uniref:uncharacterized protein n=1 Tax=Suillus clintonianus TaxID=1904413 RepID=UPI001B86F04C|nr:uncharacterized protein DEU56DRAFT_11563 [Suillus clintonianus]KAG2157260.1 hypothetical protein DEU56DRAFT_11563 [Suillus clintonianus]
MSNLVLVSQPTRECKAVYDVKIASKMDQRQWQRLRSLVIEMAARFLNTRDIYEHQDPEMVRLFYQSVSFNLIFCCPASLLCLLSQVHTKWPEVAEYYPNSWVLVRYLKIYLSKRVSRKRWADKVAREKAVEQAIQRSGRPRVQNTDLSFVRHLNTRASRATAVSRRKATARGGSTFPSGPEIMTPLAVHRSAAIAPQHNGSSPASAHSQNVPVQSSHAVFQFLDSTTPSLVKLVPDFLFAGIDDQNHLNDFFTWPEKAQRNFLLKTFSGKMNALELGAMLIALNSRRRG